MRHQFFHADPPQAVRSAAVRHGKSLAFGKACDGSRPVTAYQGFRPNGNYAAVTVVSLGPLADRYRPEAACQAGRLNACSRLGSAIRRLLEPIFYPLMDVNDGEAQNWTISVTLPRNEEAGNNNLSDLTSLVPAVNPRKSALSRLEPIFTPLWTSTTVKRRTGQLA